MSKQKLLLNGVTPQNKVAIERKVPSVKTQFSETVPLADEPRSREHSEIVIC